MPPIFIVIFIIPAYIRTTAWQRRLFWYKMAWVTVPTRTQCRSGISHIQLKRFAGLHNFPYYVIFTEKLVVNFIRISRIRDMTLRIERFSYVHIIYFLIEINSNILWFITSD